ncbi:23S rRNA (uracil(747)-C(5))-methyltransferase RlmC [Leminorella grimontii]|uniref:23S rRNA (uracil(747)-C(5))-methyltransferase RlmC n=1 Tax=Leminorella grimontii TaxID=82981 RepID=A0AAV5MZC6_9GAMM|nr:23S rRNA (uracil(747)-C(5))-methyltransferase RlmC [Leminorella grimontii]KFC95987.1 23S rRNA (uracil-5-)-methyltransferase [Leminorella grimontii ATCC 33999 = DSM 5078]GKX54832.1 23S rRNA (uracil(747)-C(5))-methyltransferase RlmC [Leminorella grimontii]VFS58368.1 23S rRNA (uracil(747)-C(5))-methyltransferase RlmC [Leminorella grimontii]
MIATEQTPCELYASGLCRSCQWLDRPYEQQLRDKLHDLSTLLNGLPVEQTLAPFTSDALGFRNKAKMVVSGSVERPILGLPMKDGAAVDLCGCPLYPEAIQALFPSLKRFIAKAGLVPYNVEKRRGELKFILVTQSRHDGSAMVRFVLRSENKLLQLRQALPELLAELPQLRVVSANVQPVHMAILEGEKEIILTASDALEERFNGIPLFIRPQSFFQTNPAVGAALYAEAQQWVSELDVSSMWDLFCGVGGFGLHCASVPGKAISLTGIEISAQAIECAKRSAKAIGLTDIRFDALDSTAFAKSHLQTPDLVLVNPPRRGIGKPLCDYLRETAPGYILYSSCNAVTMAQDIRHLADYRIVKVRLFDMFAHTAHYETLALLQRQR